MFTKIVALGGLLELWFPFSLQLNRNLRRINLRTLRLFLNWRHSKFETVSAFQFPFYATAHFDYTVESHTSQITDCDESQKNDLRHREMKTIDVSTRLEQHLISVRTNKLYL